MATKLDARKKIMKKKFESVVSNRIEHENEQEESPDAISFNPPQDESNPPETDASLRNFTTLSNTTHQLRLATKSYTKRIPKTTKKLSGDKNKPVNIISVSDNPNTLCDQLRRFLSTQIINDVSHDEINTTIAKLRDLNTIV